MPAEKLDYPDAHFDVVVGIDILHHVDIPRAIKEVRRVLKPGGVAIFKEPIEAPVLERVRMSRLVNSLAPRQVSFEKRLHTTEDERKLGPADVTAIAKELHIERTYRFSLLNRLSRFAPSQYARLMWLDYQAFRIVPPLGMLGDVRIWQCRR
jgi:ubiquinone/menaquinone biosynthesis C-methylase UbiE